MSSPERSIRPTDSEIPEHLEDLTCNRCMNEDLLTFPFSYAFQSIVHIARQMFTPMKPSFAGPRGKAPRASFPGSTAPTGFVLTRSAEPRPSPWPVALESTPISTSTFS